MPLFGPAASSGTVTSVDVAAPAPLASSGGPVTGSGTVTLSWAGSQTANRILASPNGSSGAVSLRALVAGDVPAVNPSALTGSGTVPLAGLAGITHTQMDAAAGITSGQVASVNPSALTGSGTVPLAGLSGITTSQLDAAAGILSAQIAALATSKLTGTIGASQLAVSSPSSGQLSGLTTSNLSASAALVAGQIASVNPSVLTGSGTVPLAGIPAHGGTHGVGQSDDDYRMGGNTVGLMETYPRWLTTGAIAIVSGTVYLMMFTADASYTASSISWVTGAVQTAANPTTVRFGLYTVDGSGNSTLVAATASDTTLLAAQSTNYTKALSLAGDLSTSQTTYALTRGSRYALAVIWYGASSPTPPSLLRLGGLGGSVFNLTPILSGARTTQTDLPLSSTVAQAPGTASLWYGYLS